MSRDVPSAVPIDRSMFALCSLSRSCLLSTDSQSQEIARFVILLTLARFSQPVTASHLFSTPTPARK
jgi:hypothetical protein